MNNRNYYRPIFKYNSIWGYWFRENFYGRVPSMGLFHNYHTIQTNSVGARTTNDINLLEKDKKKIMFVGCSYTAGDGVSNKDRFSDIIEETIGDIRTHNYALPGSGNDQQHLIHNYFAPLINPDVLVLSPYVGCIGRNILKSRPTLDPLTNFIVQRPKPYFKIENDKLF